MKHTRTYDQVEVTFPLTHVFCGQIDKENGKAGGFHSRPGRKDPPADSARKCARPWKIISYHVKNFGFPASEGCEVFNANTNKWIRRQANTNYYGFFPNQWTVSDVVNKVSKCTSKCCRSVDCVKKSKICLSGFTQTKSYVSFNVMVLLKNANEMHIDINSAFPVKTRKDGTCVPNATCQVKALNCLS